MNNRILRRCLKPSGAMEEKSSGRRKARATNPPASPEDAVPAAAGASLLTDDLIVEILARLPARSIHRFKCVSPSWHALITDPANRKKLPQTLAGFLYSTYHREDPHFLNFHFANISAGAASPVDPSLPFLPPDEYWYVDQLDTCNGLLLCRAHKFPSSPYGDDDEPLEYHYIVCNPATERWVDLPSHPEVPNGLNSHRTVVARLAFDPAASSHFHVLQFEENDGEDCVTGVNIYSSQTGAWKHRQSRLVEKITLYAGLTSVFFQGMLHLLGMLKPVKMDNDAVLVAVDMEGQVWKAIRVPSGGLSFGTIGVSQGCLHYASTPIGTVNKNKEDASLANKIALVWCMEDYDSKQWALKHSVSNEELQSITRAEYKVAAVHPDCDTIFLDSCDDDTLASYDLQHRKFHKILNLRKNKGGIFLPYVPLFSESLAGADGQ